MFVFLYYVFIHGFISLPLSLVFYFFMRSLSYVVDYGFRDTL